MCQNALIQLECRGKLKYSLPCCVSGQATAPTEVCCPVCVSGWAGGPGRSWKLSHHLDSPFLAYFTLQNDVCLFTGMYSGSSANHNGPSPGALPPPHDIPSRHHPLDSTLSSPHHHQSPLESAREGYVCETCLASVWHDSERLIVYLGLHECCLNEKH